MLVAPTCAEKHVEGLQKFLKIELAASWATTAFPKCHRPNRIAIIGLGKKERSVQYMVILLRSAKMGT